jgi:excisionase family DNA binding protein
MSATIESLLLTPREAARMLAVSARHLWTLTQTGRLPRVLLGRSVRYDPADLRRFVETNKSKAPE